MMGELKMDTHKNVHVVDVSSQRHACLMHLTRAVSIALRHVSV